MVQEQDFCKALEEALEIESKQVELQDVFREKLDFHCVKQDMPDQKKTGSVSKKEKMDSLRRLGEKQPAIKKIIDDFDAEIIDRL